MGIQVAVSKTPYRLNEELERVQFTSGIPGGYLTLIVTLKRDLAIKHNDIELWEEITVYDGEKILWQGTIAETPKIYPNTIQINAVGYWQHLADDSFGRIYCDTSYANWESSDESSEAGMGKAQLDTNNRLFFKLPVGQSNANVQLRANYKKLYYLEQQVHRITFDWATGAEYDSTEQSLRLLASDVGGGNDTLWTAATGAGSGAQDITLGTKRDYLRFVFDFVGAKNGHENYWVNITNLKVYGYHDTGSIANVYASEVIKELRTKRAPRLSADNTDISATTYVMEPFAFPGDLVTGQRVINAANKYHNYNVGVRGKQLLDGTESSDSLPAIFFYPHDDTTAHYITDKEHCALTVSGKSIENCYNVVKVQYHDANGILNIVTATATDGYIQDRIDVGDLPADFYRTLTLTVATTSSTKATEVADTALAEVKNLRARGTCTIKGTVRNQYGSDIPVSHIEPGYNIRIQDIETTEDMFDSTDKRSAANTFKITRVVITHENNVAIANLELDSPGGQLDVLLAKMGQVIPKGIAPFNVPDPTWGGRIEPWMPGYR